VDSYFADTSFWIALSSKRDQYHSRAIAWQVVVMRSASRIVTTEAMLWEWLNAMAHATTRAISAEVYRRVHEDKRIEIVPFDPVLNGTAVDLYRSRIDKDWSLTDCLSVVVMERHRLTEALTSDHHFEQAGMKAVMLSPPSL
jgi:predicted nucleic acid-binding protein